MLVDAPKLIIKSTSLIPSPLSHLTWLVQAMEAVVEDLEQGYMTILLCIFFGVGLLLRGANSSTLSSKSKTPRQGTCMYVAIAVCY